jgi:hypothetical protein
MKKSLTSKHQIDKIIQNYLDDIIIGLTCRLIITETNSDKYEIPTFLHLTN